MNVDYRLFSERLAGYEQEVAALFPDSAAVNFRPTLSALREFERPKRSYLICFVNRSGSTILAQALTKTRLLGRPGEFFNPEPIANTRKRERLTCFEEYLRSCIRRTSTPNGTFGAKVGIHQLAYLTKHGHIKKYFPGCKFLFVTRRDLIMQAVSLAIAWQTGAWTNKIRSTVEPHLNLENIGKQLHSIAITQSEFESFFSAHELSPLRITYEDIHTDLDAVMQRIVSFLDMSPPNNLRASQINLEIQRTNMNYEWARHFIRSCKRQLSSTRSGD